MIPQDKFDKVEKRVVGVAVFVLSIIILLIVAVVGTGLYLAVHNWG